MIPSGQVGMQAGFRLVFNKMCWLEGSAVDGHDLRNGGLSSMEGKFRCIVIGGIGAWRFRGSK